MKASRPPVPECDAGRRNRQALHALELDWGAGKFDYTKIRGILTGHDTEPCEAERISE